MSDRMDTFEHGGTDWPKTLYPHGGGREWSDSTHGDRWKEDAGVEVVPVHHQPGAVDLDALVAEVAKRLAASSSLDEATAWNLLYPPNGALAPLVPHLRGDLNA